ncbi:hypothetical protein GCM10028819_10240 [Spirosoma humi]
MTRFCAILLLNVLGSIAVLAQTDRKPTDDSSFRKNIHFNHLFVVVDDSTYTYLFDRLHLPKDFAWTREQTQDAGSASWSGKYIMGTHNYLEIFKAGGLKGSKVGDGGLGFTTDKLGTLDSLHTYWANTLDSVHVDHTTSNNDGNVEPWFTSVSIPNVDGLNIRVWVFENSKEEMTYAGFSDQELTREISYWQYTKHITAKLRKVALDSVVDNKRFDRITSVSLTLSRKELSYLRRSLQAIGFTKKGNSFIKGDFQIRYLLTESAHFIVNEIGISLAAPLTRKTYSSPKIVLLVEGKRARMIFKK